MLKFVSFLILFTVSTVCLAESTLTLHNRIIGVTKKPYNNIAVRLNSEQEQLGQPLTINKIQTFYQKAPDYILSALQPYGYFQAQVKSNLQHSGNKWTATYLVSLGMPLRIAHVTVSVSGPGQDNAVLQQLLRDFPLKAGQILHITQYNNIKNTFLTAAQSQGYINATLSTHVINIDLQHYSADIILHLTTGQRYFFGPVSFSPTPYDTEFLRRYLPFAEGMPFSNSALLTLQDNLSNAIYFQHVVVKPEPEQAINNQIPIAVNLTPRPRCAYNVGLGYGTDTGFRGNLGLEWRHVTSWGHYIQAAVQASQVQNNFQARYVIPGHNPVNQRYSIIAGVMTNSPGTGQYRTYQFGGNYVSNVGSWVRTLSLTYQHERFNLFENSPSTLTEYIVPQLSFEKIVTDNRINTNNGYRIYLNVQGGEDINFKSGFAQAELQMKFVKTIAKKHRFIFRTDLGYTTIKDTSQFPLSLRFFAGGSQSVRGYSYQSLGPGRYLTVGSAEYQYKLHKKLYSAIFFDAGNAFDNTPWHLERSVGAGLVYRSPLGPIEVSIARPLNNPSPSFFKSFRIQFVIGPDL